MWFIHNFYDCFSEEMNIRSSHGTLVVFLQNDGGFEKWGPTPERLSELALSFQAAKRSAESNQAASKPTNN